MDWSGLAGRPTTPSRGQVLRENLRPRVLASPGSVVRMLRTSLLQLLLMALPWGLRRRALNRIFGFRIHPDARIGISIVAPAHLEMNADATIGHLNLIRGMDLVRMARGAGISHLNWVTGASSSARHFAGQSGRRSELIFEEGGGITRRHFVDCSDRIVIGRYSMVAGYGVQLLTHSVEMETNHQGTKPIRIGAFCLVGTRAIMLGGAVLPDYSALGAGSVLRNAYETTHRVYSGVPAKEAAEIPADSAYFQGSGGQPAHRL
jgi:serine acetyltransferase